MNQKEALQSAIGLCWSEANRWRGSKTGDHWKEVATTLRREFFMDEIIEEAKAATKPERDAAIAAETVGQDVMGFVVR